MGASFAPFGTMMTVCNLTPSRMGIITSRLTYSKLSVTGTNLAGVSLGKAGYVVGVETFWASEVLKKSRLEARRKMSILARSGIAACEPCRIKHKTLRELRP